MMQTTTQNVVVMPSDDGSTYPNYSKKSSTVLGSFHLVDVFVIFVASVVGVTLVDPDGPKNSLVFSLICSALYIAAGICVVVAGCNGKRGVVIASLVLNIISAVFAVINAIIFVVAIAVLQAAVSVTRDIDFGDTTDVDRHLTTILAICYVLFFCYLAQAVVTIWTSAIGCSVTCCGKINQSNPPVVVTTTGAPVVVAMHGQPMQPPSYGYDQPNYDEQAGGYNHGAGMPPKQ